MARRSSARIRCAAAPSEGNELTPRQKTGAPEASSKISPLNSIVTRAVLTSVSDHRPSFVPMSQTTPTKREVRWTIVMRWPTDQSSSLVSSRQLMTPCVPFKDTKWPITRGGSYSRRSYGNPFLSPTCSISRRSSPIGAGELAARGSSASPIVSNAPRISRRSVRNECMFDRPLALGHNEASKTSLPTRG